MKRKDTVSASRGFMEAMISRSAAFVKNRDTAKMRIFARGAATFILSLMLGSVSAPGGTYPLSYAVVAAATGCFNTVFAFCGAVIATVTMETDGVLQALILAGVLGARLMVSLMRGDGKDSDRFLRCAFSEKVYVRVMIASAGAAVFGIVGMLHVQSIYYSIFSALLGIGGAFLSTAAFASFADMNADASRRAGGLAVFSLGFCASLSMLDLPFSIGAVFAFLGAVYFSFSKDGALGALVGFSQGLALGPSYAAAFGAVGIISSLLWESSRVAAVVASALVASVLALFSEGLSALSEVIPEIALAAAVAAPLMKVLARRGLPAFFDFERAGAGIPFLETGRGRRYARVGKALDELSELLLGVGDRLRLPTRAEAKRICTSARVRHCSGCAFEGECTGRDEQTVASMFSNMAYRLTVSGSVSARIVPESVARRCFNMDSIIEFINHQTRKQSGLSEDARRAEMFASDYSAVATLLRDLSGDEEYALDKAAGDALLSGLSSLGFSFLSSSVYGKRARRVYMRGVDIGYTPAGERDIRVCAEEILGTRLSSPEFSLDGKYVNASMHSIPAFSVECGRFAKASGRDQTSGDSACFFENGDGYHYTLVSDGMGSGREAALTSGISAEFLRKLLSAGCPMRSALEMLNCFVRGSSGECFTTVDLMEADLYTGRARFIKSGAAPSFIIRRGQLYRIHSKTVPVGIMQALDAEAVAFDLAAGDTVVMVSDGVTGSYEDCPWLYELLSGSLSGLSAPAIARTIGDEAVRNTGREDDITVCVLKISSEN